MKTVIKNILDTLLSEEDQKKAIYTDTGLRTTEDEWEIPYLHLITEQGFVNKLANYLWNNAPRSKSKPKIMWPEGMLNYDKFEYIVEDIQALFGSTIMDGTTKEYLEEFYQKNLIHNVK